MQVLLSPPKRWKSAFDESGLSMGWFSLILARKGGWEDGGTKSETQTERERGMRRRHLQLHIWHPLRESHGLARFEADGTC